MPLNICLLLSAAITFAQAFALSAETVSLKLQTYLCDLTHVKSFEEPSVDRAGITVYHSPSGTRCIILYLERFVSATPYCRIEQKVKNKKDQAALWHDCFILKRSPWKLTLSL